jgi:hypothetical protein
MADIVDNTAHHWRHERGRSGVKGRGKGAHIGEVQDRLDRAWPGWRQLLR